MSMREAANELAKHRRYAEAILKLHDAAELAASMENTVEERKAMVAAADAHLDDVKAQAEGIEAEVAALRESAKSAERTAQGKAEQIIAEARAQGVNIVAEAQAQADAILPLIDARNQKLTEVNDLLRSVTAELNKREAEFKALLDRMRAVAA